MAKRVFEFIHHSVIIFVVIRHDTFLLQSNFFSRVQKKLMAFRGRDIPSYRHLKRRFVQANLTKFQAL